MNILDVTPRFPYPLTDGALICMYQTIVALRQNGHNVCVVALDEHPPVSAYVQEIEQYAELHRFEYHPSPRAVGALKTLFSTSPYTQAKKNHPQMYRLMDRLHESHRFDAVLVDEIHIAQYGSYMKQKYGLPYLLRCHNVEYEIYQRYTDTVRNPLMRSYMQLQTDRWKRFEVEQWNLTDACAVITERDGDVIRTEAPSVNVGLVPAAVDMSKFQFVPPEQRETASLIILGNMQWEPNRDAAVWFASEILPAIVAEVPNVVCHLVGDNPPLKQLPEPSANFRIEGRVESISEFYNRVAIGVIPLRVGGGMRVKMVEMMASGIPIVSTYQGAEGNAATPEEHYLLADDSDAFAKAVIRLLQDQDERVRLSQNGYRLVQQYYSLEGVGNQLNELLNSIVHPL